MTAFQACNGRVFTLNQRSVGVMLCNMFTKCSFRGTEIYMTLVSPDRAGTVMDDRCTYPRRHRVSQWASQCCKAMVSYFLKQENV